MEVKSKKLKEKNMWKFNKIGLSFRLQLFAFLLLPFALIIAQEPTPSAPKSVSVPAVKEKILRNGLKVVVIEKRSLPLVTVQFLTSQGSNGDYPFAGTANLTTTLLTKGTKTKTATQIAESMEFLGGSINSRTGFLSSEVTIGVTSDKLLQAINIMADVLLNPSFKQSEIDLAKKQIIDDLSYQQKQPGSLASFVATTQSFDEWLTSGTVESVKKIKRKEILESYKNQFKLQDATLIFTGDISAIQAFSLAQRYFGKGSTPVYLGAPEGTVMEMPKKAKSENVLKKILVVDLPDSGQSAVLFAKEFEDGKRDYDRKTDKSSFSKVYFPAIVMNSLFGGGYSSRLNQEVRIKRGLSYGAGSSIIWRHGDSKFIARCQTKNESAAEVAELIVTEINRLTTDLATNEELNPRKAVLTGDFGRDLETTFGLSGALGDLYLFNLSPGELNTYMDNVRLVTPENVRSFANEKLKGGDIIIVGDYNVFKDDLKKRFPQTAIQVIPADKLDLKSVSLGKK